MASYVSEIFRVFILLNYYEKNGRSSVASTGKLKHQNNNVGEEL